MFPSSKSPFQIHDNKSASVHFESSISSIFAFWRAIQWNLIRKIGNLPFCQNDWSTICRNSRKKTDSQDRKKLPSKEWQWWNQGVWFAANWAIQYWIHKQIQFGFTRLFQLINSPNPNEKQHMPIETCYKPTESQYNDCKRLKSQ